jgi:ribonucleoside-diphosphate reductase alpha chain
MSLYEKLSEERKALQELGELPDWITTNSWQLLKEKYLFPRETLRDRVESIASTAASYMSNDWDAEERWYNKFFDLIWKGYLAPSTPIIANMGREKGCPVSCSGGYIGDSISDFYSGQHEAAILSKNGFGTSGYLGHIRPRGAPISGISGGANGIVPVFKDYVQMSRDVSQGSSRRGAWAGYLEITHPDFYELVNYISKNPDDANVGWIITDSFIEALDNGSQDALERYQKALKLKMITGKGYFFFVDKVNRLAPEWYRNNSDYRIHASNLCTEIALPSSQDETFTCVLSSLNLSKWKEFNSDTIFNSFVFLHCVALDFIKKGKEIKGLEKAVRFTDNHMALGLGTLGYHTYLQDNLIPFESLEAHLWNISTYKEIWEETDKASKWLATIFGECKVTKGTGYANATRIAIAPNLSSSLICGGVSQGVEPVYKNAYIQGSAAGEMERVNPSLLKIMKERNMYKKEVIQNIIKNKGSVQWVDWLTDHEKQVFKTAFEIDQRVIIREAATRQPFIDQAQSINLFFSANESEQYISEVHKEAFKHPMIKSLYYIRSESGVQTNKGECIACGS